MDVLITYLPFYRIHEVLDYFARNADALGVKRRVVYVDNMYRDKQLGILREILPGDIEVRGVNFRDRNLTFLRIIRDAKNEGWDALVVDSDNLLDDILGIIDEELVDKYGFYTVLDYETSGKHLFLGRSRTLGSIEVEGKVIPVYGYRVTGSWKGVFFIGPKQAVRLSKALLGRIDDAVIDKVEGALMSIEPSLRGFISDETTLGMVLYYSGVEEVPWVIATHHMHHASNPRGGDTRTLRLLVATAHAKLGRELMKRKLGGRIAWYTLRYKVAQLYNFAALLMS